VLSSISIYFQETLKSFPTSTETDEELLKRELSFNERNCILVRWSEKIVLQRQLDFARFALDYIEAFEHSALWAKSLEGHELYKSNQEYFQKINKSLC